MDILDSIIETAAMNRNPASIYPVSSTVAHLIGIGDITCYVDHGKSNPHARGKHVAIRFELNRKRIAASALRGLIHSGV